MMWGKLLNVLVMVELRIIDAHSNYLIIFSPLSIVGITQNNLLDLIRDLALEKSCHRQYAIESCIEHNAQYQNQYWEKEAFECSSQLIL